MKRTWQEEVVKCSMYHKTVIVSMKCYRCKYYNEEKSNSNYEVLCCKYKQLTTPTGEKERAE